MNKTLILIFKVIRLIVIIGLCFVIILPLYKMFIDSINFGEMHVFPYSRRPRTVAYNYPNQVSPEVKKERVKKLLELNAKKALEYRNNYLNKEIIVLVERKKSGLLFGHTSNYLEVAFSGNAKDNEYANVLLTEINYPVCKGVEIK